MKREIEFRAWDKREKRMLEFYQLDSIVKNIDETWGLFELLDGGTVLEDRFELMQYTGLKDKNGKELYEGDVVRMLYTDWPSNPAPNNEGLEEYKKSISLIGYVVWSKDRWEINFGKSKYGDDILDSINPGTHGECEVTGNVFENPELLTPLT